MRKIIAGVMGPGESATDADCRHAHALGHAFASAGWVLLTGGRDQGVMHAASRGASEGGGLIIGVLPTPDAVGVSEFVDLAIVTGLGHARNYVNVLSCDLIFVCGMGSGTASEVALALKSRRDVILVDPSPESEQFFATLDDRRVHIVRDVPEAIGVAGSLLRRGQVDANRGDE